MPTYLYRCPECFHEAFIDHGMLVEFEPICPVCGEIMVKKPQVIAVNWNGLRPSAGEMTPAIKQLIDDAPRRRGEQKPHQSDRLARINEEAKKHVVS